MHSNSAHSQASQECPEIRASLGYQTEVQQGRAIHLGSLRSKRNWRSAGAKDRTIQGKAFPRSSANRASEVFVAASTGRRVYELELKKRRPQTPFSDVTWRSRRSSSRRASRPATATRCTNAHCGRRAPQHQTKLVLKEFELPPVPQPPSP